MLRSLIAAALLIAGAPAEPVEAPAARELSSSQYGLHVDPPDADWTFDTPADAPGVLGAFVHRRGDQVLAIITVSADAHPQPSDPAGYAKRTFETLAKPPMSFVLGKKGALKDGGRAGFEMRFGPKDGTKKYVQRYFSAQGGGILVFGLQAPKKSFDSEFPTFEKLVETARFQPPAGSH